MGSTWFATFLIIAGLFALMAVGVLFGRGPIKGSCGGLSAFREGTCEICGGDPAHCETYDAADRSPESALGYDAAAVTSPERETAPDNR